MRKLLHNQVIPTLITLLCGCNIVINNPGPDDGESLDSWSETGSTTTSTSTGADSTSTGGTPCNGATEVDDTVISECCPESLGTCADWCADHGYGECLETIISVGDAACGSPDAHGDLCNVDAFDIIIATEMAVQCVCAQPGLDTGTSTTSGTSTDSTDSTTTTGGCEQTPEYPDQPPACVSCSDASQCRADEDCVCSTEFGAGVCLPTTWDECSWAPCDTPCLFVDSGWICGLPGC